MVSSNIQCYWGGLTLPVGRATRKPASSECRMVRGFWCQGSGCTCVRKKEETARMLYISRTSWEKPGTIWDTKKRNDSGSWYWLDRRSRRRGWYGSNPEESRLRVNPFTLYILLLVYNSLCKGYMSHCIASWRAVYTARCCRTRVRYYAPNSLQ